MQYFLILFNFSALLRVLKIRINKDKRTNNHIKTPQFLTIIMGRDFPLFTSFYPSFKSGKVDWVLFLDLSTFAVNTLTECNPLKIGLFSNLSK